MRGGAELLVLDSLVLELTNQREKRAGSESQLQNRNAQGRTLVGLTWITYFILDQSWGQKDGPSDLQRLGLLLQSATKGLGD